MLSSLILSLNTLLPTILTIILGYFIKTIKLIKQETFDDFNNIIFRLFLPLVLFNSIYTTELSEVINIKAIIYSLISLTLIVLITSIIINKTNIPNKRKGAIVQGIYRSNFLIIVFPLIEKLYGNSGIGIASGIIAFSIPLSNLLAVVELEYFSSDKTDIKHLLIQILKNPFIIAAILGFLFKLLNINLGTVINDTISSITKASSPLSLFILGGCIKTQSITDNKKLLLIVSLLKLLIIPSIALSIAVLIGIRGIELVVMLVMFGGPVAVSSFATAKVMNSDYDLTGQLIFITTVLSSFSLVFFLTIFNYLHLI